MNEEILNKLTVPELVALRDRVAELIKTTCEHEDCSIQNCCDENRSWYYRQCNVCGGEGAAMTKKEICEYNKEQLAECNKEWAESSCPHDGQLSLGLDEFIGEWYKECRIQTGETWETTCNRQSFEINEQEDLGRITNAWRLFEYARAHNIEVRLYDENHKRMTIVNQLNGPPVQRLLSLGMYVQQQQQETRRVIDVKVI